MDRDGEPIEELTTLLEAERAGARVGASLIDEAPDAEYEALAKLIQADEVKWAKALFEALVELGSRAVRPGWRFLRKSHGRSRLREPAGLHQPRASVGGAAAERASSAG